jgi:hypothetical protein
MGGSRFFCVFFSGSAEYHNTVSYYGMSIKTEEVKPKIKLTLEFLRSKVLFPSVAELLFCFYPFRRAAVRAGVRHMLDSQFNNGRRYVQLDRLSFTQPDKSFIDVCGMAGIQWRYNFSTFSFLSVCSPVCDVVYRFLVD